MADAMPLHIRITYQPKSVNHHTLSYGSASEVSDYLFHADPRTIDTTALICALCNALNHIQTLENQVVRLGRTLGEAGDGRLPAPTAREEDLLTRAALADPAPVPVPCDETLRDIFYDHCEGRDESDGWMESEQFIAAVRTVLTNLSCTTPAPVPVGERPWEREGWCDGRGLCWWSLGTVQRWTLCRPNSMTQGWMLPATAIPLPEVAP